MTDAGPDPVAATAAPALSTPAEAAPHGFAELGRDELHAWGRRFGARLRPPALVTLTGELGSGKTALVQAICAGIGVTEAVTSPTFALVHAYRGAAVPVFHLDLYRLTSAAELDNLGWDEMLDAHAIVLVEWPERAAGRLPSAAAHLSLWHVPGEPGKRKVVW